jgi:predicted NAD/FAD-dependent oxidoreductase
MVEFAIVGSGISGSLAAAYLRKHNKSHIILEKYETIGGRFSSTTINGKRFNHANLFVRDSHLELHELINQLSDIPLERIRLDYVNMIEDQFHIDSRFIYLPKSGILSDICTTLCEPSTLHLNTEITTIKDEDDHFVLSGKDSAWKAKHVIFTTPPTGTRTILAQLGVDLDIPPTNSIFTLLATYAHGDFDFPYYKFINHSILKEMFVDRADKTIVIHANDYIHQDTETINKKLVQKAIYDAFQTYFNVTIDVCGFKIWKYGKDRIRKEFKQHFTFNKKHVFLFTDWVSSKKNSNGVEDSFQAFHQNIKKVLENS